MIIDSHAHIYSPDESAYPAIMDPYRPPAGRGTRALQNRIETHGPRRHRIGRGTRTNDLRAIADLFETL
jgi:predicted TIM-barrel fold metal-dependent hydrolase